MMSRRDQFARMSRRQRDAMPAEERVSLELAERAERKERALDTPISRRELIEAADAIVWDMSASGIETKDLITRAFRLFIEKLTP